MSAAAGMAIILFVFFLIGVTAGIVVVIAISARRADTAARRARQARPPGLRGHISARPVHTTMSRPIPAARAYRSVPGPFRAARRTRS